MLGTGMEKKGRRKGKEEKRERASRNTLSTR
jgi:hypothetical protein